jgi:hypothetical protein
MLKRLATLRAVLVHVSGGRRKSQRAAFKLLCLSNVNGAQQQQNSGVLPPDSMNKLSV